jgi:hypothetical protein
MTFPASTLPSLGTVLQNLQNVTAGVKAQAGNALVSLQSGSVDSLFIFQVLDQVKSLVTYLTQEQGVAGLNAYATAQCTGYAGTLTADITTTVNAAQAITSWIVANFPTDTGGFIQAFKLNADGSRTAATFTSAQTAGLQTAIQAFIATIG